MVVLQSTSTSEVKLKPKENFNKQKENTTITTIKNPTKKYEWENRQQQIQLEGKNIKINQIC